MAERSKHERARLANAMRYRPGDDGAIQEVRGDLQVAKILDARDALEARAEALVRGWPPLTEAQIALLSVLLRDDSPAAIPAQRSA